MFVMFWELFFPYFSDKGMGIVKLGILLLFFVSILCSHFVRLFCLILFCHFRFRFSFMFWGLFFPYFSDKGISCVWVCWE